MNEIKSYLEMTETTFEEMTRGREFFIVEFNHALLAMFNTRDEAINYFNDYPSETRQRLSIRLQRVKFV